MFSRILYSTIAAATLAAAAPALAGDSKDHERADVPKCCERVAMQIERGEAKRDAAEPKKAPPPVPEKTTAPAEEEDPNVRNQSWGG